MLQVSFYGGLFSVLPAYLADVFGQKHVGAIHGRVLTAWSAAGLAGPSLLAALRQRSYNAVSSHTCCWVGAVEFGLFCLASVGCILHALSDLSVLHALSDLSVLFLLVCCCRLSLPTCRLYWTFLVKWRMSGSPPRLALGKISYNSCSRTTL